MYLFPYFSLLPLKSNFSINIDWMSLTGRTVFCGLDSCTDVKQETGHHPVYQDMEYGIINGISGFCLYFSLQKAKVCYSFTLQMLLQTVLITINAGKLIFIVKQEMQAIPSSLDITRPRELVVSISACTIIEHLLLIVFHLCS